MLTTAFMQVLDMTIAASIVIVAVIAARLLLKRAPKIFSYALWAIVLFRLLCPFSLESQVSVIPEIAPVSQSYELAGEPVSILGASEAAYQAVGDALNGGLGIQHIRTTEQAEDGMTQFVTSDWWDVWILFGQYAWAAGITFMALRGGAAYVKLRRQLVGAARLHDNVYLADGIEMPFVMGIFRPRIYLPSSLGEHERPYVILHEQHHIKRFDHITRALSFVALCVHWFNPLVWAAFALSGKDMEMSCDEAVMRKMGAEIRADYSASLLGFATGRRAIAGTPLAFGEGDTRSRIENLARWKKPTTWVVAAAVAVCIVAAVALATNPKGQPEDGLFPGYYQVEEIIYKNAWYAELDFLSEEDLPQVNLSAAGLLLLSNDGEWFNAGMTEETTLKKGNFDEYFYGVTYESSPGALRRASTEAYVTITVPTAANGIAALAQVEGLGDHDQLIFYAFSTRDGSAYLACGSWDEEALSDPASDDSEFLWVAKLAKSENLTEPEYSQTSSTQSWLGHFWERSTGLSMGEGQSELVERLSQDVGVSEEAGGLKVTVDSATVGGDCFFLLLRVEGMGLSPSESYGFDGAHLTVTPDPVVERHPSSMSGYGCDFLGIDGDGAALILLDYHAITADAAFTPGETFAVSLILSDFYENPTLTEREKLLVEGDWSFSFSLMRNETLDSIALPDAEVIAMDMGPNAEDAGLSNKRTAAALTNIELDSTGLTFVFHHESGRLALDPHIEAVLNDGRTVGIAGGGGVSLADGTLWCSYIWPVPLDLGEVASVSIGGATVTVPRKGGEFDSVNDRPAEAKQTRPAAE